MRHFSPSAAQSSGVPPSAYSARIDRYGASESSGLSLARTTSPPSSSAPTNSPIFASRW